MKFEERVKAAIEERTGYEVTIKEVPKMNEKLTGIIINMGIGYCPVVYKEKLLPSYFSGMPFDEIIDEIIEQLEPLKKGELPINPLDEEITGDMIQLRVMSVKGNEEFLEDKPSIRIADLAAVFTVVKNDFHVVLSNVDADKIGSRDELINYAFGNLEPVLCDVHDYYDGEDKNLLVDPQHEDSFMYVLTTVDGLFGAAAICDVEIRRKVALVVRSSYYVLPSSVHELIIVPSTAGVSIQDFKETVLDTNNTVVDDADVLSNNVYFVSVDGEMEVVA